MAKANIEITINTPTGVTIAEALRLFTEHHNYEEQVTNPDYDPEVEGSEATIPNVSRGQFAKVTIARLVKEAIRAQKQIEAQQAVDLGEGIDVT